MTGVFAALSYVVFTFLQFKIWLPGGDATSIHFGNAVCVLGALILGGVYGGIGGAIGMTIGDLLDPVYVVYAPKTLSLIHIFPQAASPTLQYILPSFGCRSPLRRPHSDKISHKLGDVYKRQVSRADAQPIDNVGNHMLL